ncbi:MAG: hypothetical protein WCS37_19015 [Chloroflexota bacterium]|nr:hypothetical protein [Chloroflexota bacterium]
MAKKRNAPKTNTTIATTAADTNTATTDTTATYSESDTPMFLNRTQTYLLATTLNKNTLFG